MEIDDLLDTLPECCHVHIDHFISPLVVYRLDITRVDSQCIATYKNEFGSTIFYGASAELHEAIKRLKEMLDSYGVKKNRFEFVYDTKNKTITFMESQYRPIVPKGDFDINELNLL